MGGAREADDKVINNAHFATGQTAADAARTQFSEGIIEFREDSVAKIIAGTRRKKDRRVVVAQVEAPLPGERVEHAQGAIEGLLGGVNVRGFVFRGAIDAVDRERASEPRAEKVRDRHAAAKAEHFGRRT